MRLMRWCSILSKYPIITYNNFFYSRENSSRKFQQLFSLLTSIPFLFTKKSLITPYSVIVADSMTFLDILFVKLSKFSSGMSDFFPLPYTRSVCGLTETSKVKPFSSCQTIFLIIWMLLSNLSLRKPARVSLLFRVSSFTHLWCFQALELFKVYFFTILCSDDRLVPVCSAIFLGAKCVWGWSSCNQTNTSIKSIFSFVETILGCPKLFLLSISCKRYTHFELVVIDEPVTVKSVM